MTFHGLCGNTKATIFAAPPLSLAARTAIASSELEDDTIESLEVSALGKSVRQQGARVTKWKVAGRKASSEGKLEMLEPST